MNEQITTILKDRGFKGVKTINDIQKRFVEFARMIMYSHVLGERRLQITALELYLFADSWCDPNTHKNPEQLNSGTWYVHPKSAAPNHSGIDITVGCKTEEIYCGLLIREVDKIDGPGKSFKRIVRDRDVPGYRWLPEEKPFIKAVHGTDIESGPLKLIGCTEPTQTDLWIGPRLNLSYPMHPWNADLRIATWKTKNETGMKQLSLS